MSTPRDLPPVYIEFPNFGYGPASAALALVEPIIDSYSWHIVSTGGAAQFAQKHLPNAALHDIDSFHPENWVQFLRRAPRGSVVLSATNPHFAGWAARNGYRVGIIDTLDWMWEVPPPGVEDAEFHLVQRYFGFRPVVHGTNGIRQPIRPIVDAALWISASGERRPGSALIGFGGMAVPGRDAGTADYVAWLLAAVLPVLVEHEGCSRVAVVGARADIAELVPAPWSRHPAIEVHAGLDRARYATLVRASEHLVLAPGLASIHECAAAGLAPMIQPGFSMSMVLQASDLQATGYPHIAAWPWAEEAVGKLAGMAEVEGLGYLADLIDTTVGTEDPDTCGITHALRAYLDRSPTQRLELPETRDLPDGRTLLAEHLHALT